MIFVSVGVYVSNINASVPFSVKPIRRGSLVYISGLVIKTD